MVLVVLVMLVMGYTRCLRLSRVLGGYTGWGEVKIHMECEFYCIKIVIFTLPHYRCSSKLMQSLIKMFEMPSEVHDEEHFLPEDDENEVKG